MRIAVSLMCIRDQKFYCFTLVNTFATAIVQSDRGGRCFVVKENLIHTVLVSKGEGSFIRPTGAHNHTRVCFQEVSGQPAPGEGLQL